ncbi:MAG: C39 family peptidase [Rickettsiales bacterium]
MPIFSAQAADIPLYGSGYSTNFKVQSYKERQFKTVVRQQFDFSCGSAALATLLDYHYDWPVDERDVLISMYAKGDKEKIRKEGFSLLDMKQYLASIGFKANGFRTDLNKLNSVGIPAIVLINNAGYLHFVVVKGVTQHRVLVGDPAIGLKVFERSAFEKMWNGILFVILNDKEYAQQTFNRDQDWKTKEKANFDAALSDQALAGFTVHISPTPGYFY